MPKELVDLFNDQDLEKLRVSKPLKAVFLCGGAISTRASLRPENLRDYLLRYSPIKLSHPIILAESAYSLYRDAHYDDLISMEEDVAQLSAIVLVIAESAGSLAELGAFSSNEYIKPSAALNLRYTRYADDISVSGNSVDELRLFEERARAIIRACKSPSLIFNEDKRGLYSKGQRRMVTGLIITPTKEISLGRARKREISALLHRSSLGQLDPKRQGLLKGLLGFALAHEQLFVERLRKKYGDPAVDFALKYYVPLRERTPPA